MLTPTYCNILLIIAGILILSYFAYNISNKYHSSSLNNTNSLEGFASRNNRTDKLNNLRNNNSKSKKLAKLNNTKNARKSNFKNTVRENLENVDYKSDDSHILDADYIKNRFFNYYHSFDTKTMNSKANNMKVFNQKWKFLKDQFWDIFEV